MTPSSTGPASSSFDIVARRLGLHYEDEKLGLPRRGRASTYGVGGQRPASSPTSSV